jgi:hypothetical protein
MFAKRLSSMILVTLVGLTVACVPKAEVAESEASQVSAPDNPLSYGRLGIYAAGPFSSKCGFGFTNEFHMKKVEAHGRRDALLGLICVNVFGAIELRTASGACLAKAELPFAEFYIHPKYYIKNCNNEVLLTLRSDGKFRFLDNTTVFDIFKGTNVDPSNKVGKSTKTQGWGGVRFEVHGKEGALLGSMERPNMASYFADWDASHFVANKDSVIPRSAIYLIPMMKTLADLKEDKERKEAEAAEEAARTPR